MLPFVVQKPASHRHKAGGDGSITSWTGNFSTVTANVQFTLVGIESLRTLKVAARGCGLSDQQVEDVFFNNGADLFAQRGIS